MKKQRLFKIMSNTNCETLKELSSIIAANHNISIVKEPAKTLTMIKMREPVQKGLFYIGEVISCEAIVSSGDFKGMAVTMGDDFEKVLSMAIIDCGFNANFDEIAVIKNKLLSIEQKQTLYTQKENAMHLKTMVNFNNMVSEG